jgi:hypothetical protein
MKEEETSTATSSSWPLWPIAVIALQVILQWTLKDGRGPDDYLIIACCGLILVRWLVARWRHERNRSWIAYFILLLFVPFLVIRLQYFVVNRIEAQERGANNHLHTIHDPPPSATNHGSVR